MRFCVDAKPGEVRHMLAERGIAPDYVEWDDTNCVTEVSVHPDVARAVILDLARSGWRWWHGHARTPHADTTAAQAIAHITRGRAA